MAERERVRPPRSETRRRVLDAAFTTFGERGIAATSLNEVAAAAGLTKGAVYSNFASKDELVLALMEEHVAHRLQGALAAHDPDKQAALRARRREARETITRALIRIAEMLDDELPLPAPQFAVVLMALSNGLAVEAEIDPEAVPEDLLARVLTLIAGDVVGKIRHAAASVTVPPETP